MPSDITDAQVDAALVVHNRSFSAQETLRDRVRSILEAALATRPSGEVRRALEFALEFKITDSNGNEVAEDSLHEIRKVARAALASEPATDARTEVQ